MHNMQLHGYSKLTQEAYVRAVRQLRDFFQLSPAKISEEQLREYFLHCKNADKWAANSMKIAYCGIKFFCQYTLMGPPQPNPR